jgi:hypothetical protein
MTLASGLLAWPPPLGMYIIVASLIVVAITAAITREPGSNSPANIVREQSEPSLTFDNTLSLPDQDQQNSPDVH